MAVHVTSNWILMQRSVPRGMKVGLYVHFEPTDGFQNLGVVNLGPGLQSKVVLSIKFLTQLSCECPF